MFKIRRVNIWYILENSYIEMTFLHDVQSNAGNIMLGKKKWWCDGMRWLTGLYCTHAIFLWSNLSFSFSSFYFFGDVPSPSEVLVEHWSPRTCGGLMMNLSISLSDVGTLQAHGIRRLCDRSIPRLTDSCLSQNLKPDLMTYRSRRLKSGYRIETMSWFDVLGRGQ